MNSRFRCDYRHLRRTPAEQDTPEFSFSKHLVSQFSSLDNDIHPIFSAMNFPGADYELLKPSLQLASLLIDTDCLLDFWHAIFFGINRRVDEDYNGERWHMAYFRPRATLTAKDRAMTRLRLRSLSHTFKFHRDKALKDFGGMCDCTDRLAQSHLFDRGDVRGVVEGIRYGESIYQGIRIDYDWAEHCGDLDAIERVQKAHFSFAALLVHEVAHAAVAATVGTSEPSIFENNTMSEDGFDWENFVFGGVIKASDDGLAISEWPSPSVRMHYLKHDCYCWMQEGGSHGDVEARWDIPLEFVDSLFSMKFWNDDITTRGAAALKVPKITGRRGQVTESGAWIPYQPDACSAYYFNGIPPGWWADRDCLHPIEQGAEIAEEGFGRLMRINLEGLYDDEYWPQFWR